MVKKRLMSKRIYTLPTGEFFLHRWFGMGWIVRRDHANGGWKNVEERTIERDELRQYPYEPGKRTAEDSQGQMEEMVRDFLRSHRDLQIWEVLERVSRVFPGIDNFKLCWPDPANPTWGHSQWCEDPTTWLVAADWLTEQHADIGALFRQFVTNYLATRNVPVERKWTFREARGEIYNVYLCRQMHDTCREVMCVRSWHGLSCFAAVASQDLHDWIAANT